MNLGSPLSSDCWSTLNLCAASRTGNDKWAWFGWSVSDLFPFDHETRIWDWKSTHRIERSLLPDPRNRHLQTLRKSEANRDQAPDEYRREGPLETQGTVYCSTWVQMTETCYLTQCMPISIRLNQKIDLNEITLLDNIYIAHKCDKMNFLPRLSSLKHWLPGFLWSKRFHKMDIDLIQKPGVLKLLCVFFNTTLNDKV